MSNAEDFELAWRQLEARLHRLLASRGTSPWVRDDVVQETGLRLFRTWDQVDGRGPWSLAATIAVNVLCDETARRNARESVGDVPDAPGPQDVEEAVLARLELARVAKAIKSLRPNYRNILLSELGHPAPLEGNVRAINMLRMRARQRLSMLVERSASSVGIGLPAAVKSQVGSILSVLRRNPSVPDALAATTVALATATLLLAPPQATRLEPNDIGTSEESLGVQLVGHSVEQSEPRSLPGLRAGRTTRTARDLARNVGATAQDLGQELTEEPRTGVGTEIGRGGPVYAYLDVDFDTEARDSETESPRCEVQMDDAGARAACRSKIRGRGATVSASTRVNERP